MFRKYSLWALRRSAQNKVVETYSDVWMSLISVVTICPACYRPTTKWIDSDQNIYVAPRAAAKEAPEGAPKAVAEVWDEGEKCYKAQACNAAALMYRKIIFFVAVDRGLSKKTIAVGLQVSRSL